MTSIKRFWRNMAEGRESKVGTTILKAILCPFSLVYANIIRLRALGYKHGAFCVNRLPRPVIAVGNLTVGGTGKTPMVALLCCDLQKRGKRVTVLSRGYGGTIQKKPAIVSDGHTLFLSPIEAGDEPYLLAADMPGVAVVVGRDRYQAGLLALNDLKPDIFILDDGFQHLRLWRDMNILLLDSSSPFGNGLTIPAGLLREPVGEIKRADLVVETRCDKKTPPLSLEGHTLCRTEHHLTGVIPLGGGPLKPFTALAGKRVLAFAGIADPDSFFDTLRSVGINIVTQLPLPDHCSYSEKELATLCHERNQKNIDALITTSKDGVKLVPHLARLGTTYVARLEIRISDPKPLQAAIEKLLQ